jgi:hypothetical protein
MGKPRKNPEPTENPCCVRERQRRLQRIRDTFTAFPVIKDVPCPTCKQWIRIRVYGRDDLEAAG